MNNDGIIEGTFTRYFFERFKETFDCEIELLQGEVKVLDDDTVWFKIQLTGYKVDMLNDLIRMLMAIPTDKVKVKYKGTQIFPN